MRGETLDVHFELYALRNGRWLMEACFADEEEARAAVRRLAPSARVPSVRLLRHVHLPGMQAPIVTTLFDGSGGEHPLPGGSPERTTGGCSLSPGAGRRPGCGTAAAADDAATDDAAPAGRRRRALVFVAACLLIAGSLMTLAGLP